MNNKIVFGQYINTNSWIHRLDPRTKLVTLFLMMIGVFLISNLYVLLGCLVFFFVVVLTSKIPLIKFLQSFKTIVMLIVFTTLFQIIFNRNGNIIEVKGYLLSFDFTLTWINLAISIVILLIYFLLMRYIKKGKGIIFLIVFFGIMFLQYKLTFGPVIVSSYNIAVFDVGLKTSLLVLLRIVNLLTLSGLLTFTTKSTDLNNGIEGIFAPFKFMRKGISILAMMISIALRFIPTLINESTKILRAQASRGVDFEDGRLKDKIFQIVSLLVPMFVISYKKAEDLANAMEARGYIPGEERSRINVLKYKLGDLFTYVFLIIFLTVIIFFKIKGVI